MCQILITKTTNKATAKDSKTDEISNTVLAKDVIIENSKVNGTADEKHIKHSIKAVDDADDYVAEIPAEELRALDLLEVIPYLPPAAKKSNTQAELDGASIRAQPSAPGSIRDGISELAVPIGIGADDHIGQPPAPPPTRSGSPFIDEHGSKPFVLPNPFPSGRRSRSSSVKTVASENNPRSISYRVAIVASKVRTWLKRKFARRSKESSSEVLPMYQPVITRRSRLLQE